MQIRCCTLFDITRTGTTGHFKPAQVPVRDQANQEIVDQTSWNRSRNQQRNLETIEQILQLRTQIFNTTVPVFDRGRWCFDFEIESQGIYQQDQDPFGILKHDCNGVPMIIGLNDEYTLTPELITQGSQQNIWFEHSMVNT